MAVLPFADNPRNDRFDKSGASRHANAHDGQNSPFRLPRRRPRPRFRVSCVPYDIVSRRESRALAGKNPDTLLRVDRADLEFPDSVPFTAPEVYRQAAKNFIRLVEERRFLPKKPPRSTWSG